MTILTHRAVQNTLRTIGFRSALGRCRKVLPIEVTLWWLLRCPMRLTTKQTSSTTPATATQRNGSRVTGGRYAGGWMWN